MIQAGDDETRTEELVRVRQSERVELRANQAMESIKFNNQLAGEGYER